MIATKSIAADLRRLLEQSEVLDSPSELRTFAYDASFMTQLAPREPDAAVIARSVEDVSATLRYAYERGIPVTPRGAASGQAAGSVALRGGIVRSVHAMDRILDRDRPNMQVFC
jgi:glycolate oxidase